MFKVRLVASFFALVGAAATALILWLPGWVPLPRIVILAAPAFVALGLAMLVRPGAELEGEFDFEDWFDECSLGERVLYSASAGVGFLVGLGLYLSDSGLDFI